MQIDWSTLGLQAVNAVVLIWLLAHFLFRPVVDAIAARQKAAGQLLADAKAGKAAAENERNKAAAEAARLAEHRSEALKAAEAEAAAAKATLLVTAQADADKLRATAKAQIEAERRTEALAAEDRAGKLAIDIVGNSGIRRRGWHLDPSHDCPRGDPSRRGGLPQSPQRCPRTSGCG